jgi:hypothetical protein
MGAGTTALVAQNLHCKAVGVELNEDYIGIIKRRLSQDVLEFSAPPALHDSNGLTGLVAGMDAKEQGNEQ